MAPTSSSVRIWLSRATDTSSSSSIRSALKPAFTMVRNVGFSFFRSSESRGHAAFSAALRSFTNRCLVVTFKSSGKPSRHVQVVFFQGMQLHRCERSSYRSFLIAALFLTKNVAPQLGTGVGSDVATCSASFASVAFLDVGFNGRSHGRSRARRLRRGFCSGSSYGLPCRSHGLFEG